MIRRLFTIASALSLLFFIAAAALWVRSFWARNEPITRKVSGAAYSAVFRPRALTVVRIVLEAPSRSQLCTLDRTDRSLHCQLDRTNSSIRVISSFEISGQLGAADGSPWGIGPFAIYRVPSVSSEWEGLEGVQSFVIISLPEWWLLILTGAAPARALMLWRSERRNRKRKGHGFFPIISATLKRGAAFAPAANENSGVAGAAGNRHTVAMHRLAVLACVLLLTQAASGGASAVFNVRDHGAVGDGKTLDTSALNQTIDVCAAAGGGQVLVPPGKYVSGTVRLKSNVALLVDAGAEIVGTSDLEQYQNFSPPDGTPLAGNLHWHRALVLGVGVENVTITGRGVINGNKVFDPNGEEHMRGPHAVLFGNSRNITLRDISIRDAANYGVMLEFTSQVEVRGVKITGGWDGVHFRGWKDNPCRDVSITDCELYTGDDCIAGWYWQNTLIDRCILNSSCNGLRLIGPAENLIVHDCLFFGPGRFEHRTSGPRKRRNMLAGLCIQPGAWDHTEGSLDGVRISDITMHDVASPLHLSLRAGNTGGRVSISRLSATGAYWAAASIESWAQSPFEHVSLRDVSLEFTGGGTSEQAQQQVRAPGVDVRPLPAWGLYARNVKTLDLENVRLSLEHDDARPALIAESVATLAVDDLKFPRGAGPSVVLRDVHEVRTKDTADAVIQHKTARP